MKKKLIIILSILLFILFEVAYYLYLLDKMKMVEVPVTTHLLRQRTDISEDDYKLLKVPSFLISDEIVSDIKELDGKTIKNLSSLANHSFFYKSLLEEKKTTRDWPLSLLEDDEVAYDIFLNDIKANSAILIPGINIDLYLTTEKPVDSALLFSNVPIIAAYDDNGSSLEIYRENKAYIITVAIKEKDVPLLNKMFLLGKVSITASKDAYKQKRATLKENSNLYELVKDDK